LGIPLPFNPIQLIVLELFMDLAASATFIAEPAEKNIMNKPPLDPHEKFMDRSMLTNIMLGALSLFAAVSITYLFTWFSNTNLADQNSRLLLSQTVAFATWMFGHIFLAFNFRSKKEPLIRLGIFSNKIMILWAVVAIGTLLVGTSLPIVNLSLRVTNLSPVYWVLVIGVAFVATFWLELKKFLRL
ncbi:MAG TPA: cation-translocating P-type ATPase C-terminal domain-containing protein, partial [Candidatus Sulfotelmatobacter sp.]|nr:cation-translocating P-type ATPase C-terminal domain-containing protein [Candidatus Sulfotelmatobacter sp.]